MHCSGRHAVCNTVAEDELVATLRTILRTLADDSVPASRRARNAAIFAKSAIDKWGFLDDLTLTPAERDARTLGILVSTQAGFDEFLAGPLLDAPATA
jgi:hypothetical protein